MLRLYFKFYVGLAILIFFSTFTFAADEQSIQIPEWTKLLNQTTKLEAVLLSDSDNQVKERTQRLVINHQDTQKLTKVFTTKANWPLIANGCIPVWAGRLIFTLKPESGTKENILIVDVCFHCSDVLATQNGKRLDGRMFSGVSDLLKFFRTLFPDDKMLPVTK